MANQDSNHPQPKPDTEKLSYGELYGKATTPPPPPKKKQPQEEQNNDNDNNQPE